MSGFIELARCIARNRDGATAIEYALLAALVAMALVGGMTLVGAQLSASFFAVANSFPTP